jgi:hypothetical protein
MTLSPEDAIWAGHQIFHWPDEAVSVQSALQGLEAHLHANEASWPYGKPAWPANRPAAATLAANQQALPPWQRLISPLDLDRVREHLDHEQPVVLTLRFVPAAWQQPKGGEVDADAGRKTPGSHAVLAVGIDASDRVLIKNSWGPKWATGGFAYISSRYLREYIVCGHVLVV